jgi:hypothetical protein
MHNGELVFSLASWTIKQEGEKFFIAKTQHWNGKHEWSRSYKTLTQAANAIARHHEREWAERVARQARFQRRFKKKAA